ncbi:hypothetical protein [Streptomyces pristinaespiralis]|uniref:hypothetical protein n=1 Tax=Streptomyces pristinaespiralis TaxID=38300 RepID=UPI0033F738FB
MALRVLDTTPLPVKVLDDVFAEPFTVHLRIALDACTHSIVAFRLTPVAESAVDVWRCCCGTCCCRFNAPSQSIASASTLSQHSSVGRPCRKGLSRGRASTMITL